MSSLTFLEKKKIVCEIIVIKHNHYQAMATNIFSLCQKVAEIGNQENASLSLEEGEAPKEGNNEQQKSLKDDEAEVGIETEDHPLVPSPVLFLSSPMPEREKLHCSQLSTSEHNDSIGKIQKISEI